MTFSGLIGACCTRSITHDTICNWLGQATSGRRLVLSANGAVFTIAVTSRFRKYYPGDSVTMGGETEGTEKMFVFK